MDLADISFWKVEKMTSFDLIFALYSSHVIFQNQGYSCIFMTGTLVFMAISKIFVKKYKYISSKTFLRFKDKQFFPSTKTMTLQ